VAVGVGEGHAGLGEEGDRGGAGELCAVGAGRVGEGVDGPGCAGRHRYRLAVCGCLWVALFGQIIVISAWCRNTHNKVQKHIKNTRMTSFNVVFCRIE